MRTLGRRAAIGATTVALVLAAAGTSLAAVRSTRYEGGILPSGTAVRPPSAAHPGPEPTLPPISGTPDNSDVFVPDALLPPTSGPGPVIAAPAAQPPAGSASIAGPTAPASGPATATPGATPAVGVVGARPAGRGTAASLPPASGPTPTTTPVRADTSCPSIAGKGALPVRGGPLQAVNFALRWPVAGPVVLVPQASAARGNGASVRIASANAQMASDGTSLTLMAPLTVDYTLQSGHEKARGAIGFTSVGGPSVSLTRQGCRDSTFAMYDVNKASLRGSPVRIVGMVARTATITISGDGGIAYFHSTVPGTHRVTLLTATDDGAAADVVTLDVIIP